MHKSKRILTKGRMAILIIIAILLIDQIIKILVKTNMALHDYIEITDWFKIYFIENNGMAWGMELGSKLFLSIFRIIAVSVIGYYIWLQVKLNKSWGYIACLSMILAGAAGNIFDCVLYGQIFTESTDYTISTLVPFGEGYAPLLMGKVVDMFYFPIIDTYWPDWMPLVGGDHFIFFSPVFNFADACISVSVILMLLFQRGELSHISLKENEEVTKKEN